MEPAIRHLHRRSAGSLAASARCYASEWLKRAAQAADQAISLDPTNLYAIGARATVLQLEGKPEQSLAMLRKQVALNRNYAPAWHRISYALLTLGQPEAALEAGNEAIRLSPRDGRLFSFMSSWQRPAST